MYEEGAESFDTSSHATLDYNLDEDNCAKSYTFGEGQKYRHIKRQRLVKRSISAGNFNWNLLVHKQDKNEAKRVNEFLNTATPMYKLKWILGEDLV